MIETIVIIALLVFIAFREWRHELHIRELEEKVMASSLTEYQQFKTGKKKPRLTPNPVTKTEDNEIALGDMPFMTIPEEYNIQVEGSPETPVEERARKK